MNRANGKKMRERPAVDVRAVVSALFEESGDIAPVDFARFGKRVGEIIARSTHPHRARRHDRASKDGPAGH
jgi:hypothetical protein